VKSKAEFQDARRVDKPLNRTRKASVLDEVDLSKIRVDAFRDRVTIALQRIIRQE
jgi:hypothetical protein